MGYSTKRKEGTMDTHDNLMNLKGIILSEKVNLKKVTSYVIPIFERAKLEIWSGGGYTYINVI